MRTIKRSLCSEYGIKSNILICVSKQQNSLKCNQFIQEDLSNGVFGLISHNVIESQVELPQIRSWNYTCNGEENIKGTRENSDKIYLDKVFYVPKESLVISSSGCGKQFVHLLWTGFCCHYHDLMNILWNSTSQSALQMILLCGEQWHWCVRVGHLLWECSWAPLSVWRADREVGKERLESKIIPQTLCLCLIIN